MGPLLLVTAKLSGCEQVQRGRTSVHVRVHASCLRPAWVGLMNIHASISFSTKEEKQDDDEKKRLPDISLSLPAGSNLASY